MAVAITSIYPAFLAFNALAVSENIFILLFILSAYLLFDLNCRKYSNWILFAAAAGGLFVVHPKAIPVMASAFIVGGYIAVYQKQLKQFAVFCGVMIFFVFFGI